MSSLSRNIDFASFFPLVYDLMNVAACADEMSGGPAGRSRPAAHAAAARYHDGGR